MLYSEIIAVCSQIHTKHINTLCGHNVELLNVKHGGPHSNQPVGFIKRWNDVASLISYQLQERSLFVFSSRLLGPVSLLSGGKTAGA